MSTPYLTVGEAAVRIGLSSTDLIRLERERRLPKPAHRLTRADLSAVR